MAESTIEKEIRLAIKAGNADKVAALIDSDKEQLHANDSLFGTWLHFAASFGKLEIVKRLVEMGANVNTNGGVKGSAPLQMAAAEGNLEIARYLLDHGAKLDVSTQIRNPLFGAIYGGHKDMASLLIDAGIDTSARYSGASIKNLDALRFAQTRGQAEIAQLLASHGTEQQSSPDASPVNAVPPGAAIQAKDARAARKKDSERDAHTDLSLAHRDIVDHMTAHFGPVQSLGLQEIIPVSGVRINVIPAAHSLDDTLILFTTGMSDQAQTVPRGEGRYRYTELFVRLPADWSLDRDALGTPDYIWPIDWLRKLAAYPFEEDTWLGGKFTIISNGDPPKPLAPNTQLSCMMLLCETEEVNPIKCRDGRKVLLYSLFPLYTEERDLEKSGGLEALFNALMEHDIPMIADPGRANCATKT